MWENFYVLDLGDLTEGEDGSPEKKAMKETMEALLDKERLLKYRQKKNGGAALQSLGAGALLALAVCEYQRAQAQQGDAAQAGESGKQGDAAQAGGPGKQGAPLHLLTPAALLRRIPRSAVYQNPEIRYRYGAQGKPYFADLPLFFSLSHSGRAVLLALSEREIGADIQRRQKMDYEKLAGRFYGKEDLERLKNCAGQGETEAEFYRIWTQKEAYGKLTGEGISKMLGESVPGKKQGIIWDLREVPLGEETYDLAICVRDGQKEDQREES